MLSVWIIMPTFRCKDYFQASFAELCRAAPTLTGRYDVNILIVLNASSTEDERVVRHALAKAPLPSHLIVSAVAGQNNATNLGVGHARAHGADIVHLVDDDLEHGPDALDMNIDSLVQMRDRLGVIGLTGSRYLVKREAREGFTSWIAALAFEPSEENPRFCMGGSHCTWADEYPELPPDSTGIANDAFICNAFYARHRELHRETGFMPIVKPAGSVCYIRVARRWDEYQKQQLRIRYGVLYAYMQFGLLESELREYFNWKFHCDALLSKPWNLLAAFRWLVFRFARHRANRAAELRLSRGIVGVDWSSVASTKHILS